MNQSNRTVESQHHIQALTRRLQQLELVEARRRRVFKIGALGLAASLAGLPAIAEAVEIPNSFGDGDVIEAAAFNENFSVLGEGLTALETSVAKLGPPISGSENIEVASNVVSLAADVTTVGDVTVGGGHLRLPIPAPSTWNNAGNGQGALVNTVSHSSCDEFSERGTVRVWVLDESTPDGDNHDALCYCRRYYDDTTASEFYNWSCFHGVNDGS